MFMTLLLEPAILEGAPSRRELRRHDDDPLLALVLE